MKGPTDSNEDYPQELLDAHRIEDGVLHVPAEDVLEALERLLKKKKSRQSESENQTHNAQKARILEIGDYVHSRSQEELYEELRAQDDPSISSAAKHLDPEWTPRTKSTYELIKLYTSSMAEFESIQ